MFITLVQALLTAQSQVEYQSSISKGAAQDEAAALARYIIELYELAPYDPANDSERLLKRWLLGEFYETNAATIAQHLLEEGAHQQGG